MKSYTILHSAIWAALTAGVILACSNEPTVPTPNLGPGASSDDSDGTKVDRNGQDDKDDEDASGGTQIPPGVRLTVIPEVPEVAVSAPAGGATSTPVPGATPDFVYFTVENSGNTAIQSVTFVQDPPNLTVRQVNSQVVSNSIGAIPAATAAGSAKVDFVATLSPAYAAAIPATGMKILLTWQGGALEIPMVKVIVP